MALFPASHESASRVVREATHEAAPWLVFLARLGYAAKGIVYLVIGGLAVAAAVLEVGSPSDTGGALRTIEQQPFGRAALAVLALGLAGYGVWRLLQATLDPEREARGWKAVPVRGGYLISAAIHLGLALGAAQRVLGDREAGGGSGDAQAERWTGFALQQPFGRWLLGAVGLWVIAFGLVEIWRGFRSDIDRRMDLSPLSPGARDNMVRFGRFGIAARGLVFGIVGWTLVRATLQLDPREATGMAGALRDVWAGPYGSWLLGAVAFGLVGYGLWQLGLARFRSITPP